MKEIQHILQSQDLTTDLMNEGFRHRFCLESQVWMEVRGSWKSLPYVQQIIVDSWFSVGVSQIVRAALTKCHRLWIIKKRQKFNSHSSWGQKSDPIGLVRAFLPVHRLGILIEPSRLQSMGSLRVPHDWATSLSLFTFMHWRRKWQPTPVFLPGESQGRGSLVGCRLWGRMESDTTEVT